MPFKSTTSWDEGQTCQDAGNIEEVRERTRAGQLNLEDGAPYGCLHKGTARCCSAGFLRCVFNLTKQSRADLLGGTFFLKSRAVHCRVWATCSSTPALPPPLWPRQCHSQAWGRGAVRNSAADAFFFLPKHNNLQQWSPSTFLGSSRT